MNKQKDGCLGSNTLLLDVENQTLPTDTVNDLKLSDIEHTLTPTLNTDLLCNHDDIILLQNEHSKQDPSFTLNDIIIEKNSVSTINHVNKCSNENSLASSSYSNVSCTEDAVVSNTLHSSVPESTETVFSSLNANGVKNMLIKHSTSTPSQGSETSLTASENIIYTQASNNKDVEKSSQSTDVKCINFSLKNSGNAHTTSCLSFTDVLASDADLISIHSTSSPSISSCTVNAQSSLLPVIERNVDYLGISPNQTVNSLLTADNNLVNLDQKHDALTNDTSYVPCGILDSAIQMSSRDDSKSTDISILSYNAFALETSIISEVQQTSTVNNLLISKQTQDSDRSTYGMVECFTSSNSVAFSNNDVKPSTDSLNSGKYIKSTCSTDDTELLENIHEDNANNQFAGNYSIMQPKVLPISDISIPAINDENSQNPLHRTAEMVSSAVVKKALNQAFRNVLKIQGM